MIQVFYTVNNFVYDYRHTENIVFITKTNSKR